MVPKSEEVVTWVMDILIKKEFTLHKDSATSHLYLPESLKTYHMIEVYKVRSALLSNSLKTKVILEIEKQEAGKGSINTS